MIYFIEAVGIGNIKVGFTDSDDANDRLATLQTGCPVPLRLLGTMPGTMDGVPKTSYSSASNRTTHARLFGRTGRANVSGLLCNLCGECVMGWEIPKSGQGKTEKPPIGNHLAILVALIDMGKQWQEPFKSGDKGYWQWRAFFVWELCGEQVSGTNNNHVIGMDLTLSTGEKSKLRQWVTGRTGKPPVEPFDPTTELGQPCFLSVIDNGKGYPKINGMAGVPKGVPIPKPTYPLTAISLEEYRTKAKTIPTFVPWLYGSPLEDHINACQEIGGSKPTPKNKQPEHAGATETGKEGDPIPF